MTEKKIKLKGLSAVKDERAIKSEETMKVITELSEEEKHSIQIRSFDADKFLSRTKSDFITNNKVNLSLDSEMRRGSSIDKHFSGQTLARINTLIDEKPEIEKLI